MTDPINNTVDKQKRYRQKMRDQGKCQHCGKPCEPFFECAERREYKRLRRIVLWGSYRTKNHSRRVPRIDNKPIIYHPGFIEDMQAEGLDIKPEMFL